MNKLFLATAIALLYGCTAVFGQTVDTIAHPQPQLAVDDASIFTDFSFSVKNIKNVNLQLNTDFNKLQQGDYFIVERSYDGITYETVGALKIEANSTQYAHTDSSALNGTDYYRIKYSGKTGRQAYSKTVVVTLSADVDFKFYPNPVDKLLIIRTGHNIDIQISDAVGTVRFNKELEPGLQVLNVSALEKGSYILRIADKQSNRVVSEHLLKN
jgi:hypothetical protein